MELEFGDYVDIEQKRYGVENEFYRHKVINVFRSNGWVDVPVSSARKEVMHDRCEDVVSCITCGVSEDEVLKYRLSDVRKYQENKKKQREELKCCGNCEFLNEIQINNKYSSCMSFSCDSKDLTTVNDVCNKWSRKIR